MFASGYWALLHPCQESGRLPRPRQIIASFGKDQLSSTRDPQSVKFVVQLDMRLSATNRQNTRVMHRADKGRLWLEILCHIVHLPLSFRSISGAKIGTVVVRFIF
jgi:hypothetical protein